MAQTPDRAGGKPTPQMGEAGARYIVVNGVRLKISKDGRITLPNGERLPASARFNGNRQVIELPAGERLAFKSGRIIRQTPMRKSKPTDSQRYYENPYSGLDQKIDKVSGKPVAAKPAPVTRPPDRERGVPAAAAPTAPAKPAPARPAVPAKVAPAAVAKPTPVAAPVTRTPAPAGRPAAAPGVAPARPAPTSAGVVPKPPAPKPTNTASVDAQVRQMFPALVPFLSDKELGPLLRKAATEGWNETRLMGALQGTKFWKTKGDAERKWIILNGLDKATARDQVEEQMQAITQMARAEGLNLPGITVHDLAVNILKNGWTGAQVREQMYAVAPKAAVGNAITTQYGYLAAFMNVPEVATLLDRGAREGWNAQRLEAELTKTSWWKTTTDSQRRFNAAQAQDPASAKQAVTQRASELLNTSNSLGVRIPPDRLNKIAEDSLRFGWSDAQTRAALAGEFDFQGGEGGMAGQSARQIKEMADAYLVPLSDGALEQWVEQMVAGSQDMESFTEYIKEQAKSLNPTAASAIDRGQTVRQWSDPYVQTVARELEMNPADVDIADPKWRVMLDQVDPKTKERSFMTLTAAAEYARTRPEWQKTRAANEKAAALTENILRTFGATA